MTKAELFRYLAERSGLTRRAAPRVAAAPETPKPPHRHNESERAARKAQYALEDSAGRPSRKSTRGSSNRQKNDVRFRMQRQTREAQSSSRPRSPPR
jgi:hypothetical protein